VRPSDQHMAVLVGRKWLETRLSTATCCRGRKMSLAIGKTDDAGGVDRSRVR
jgi:hypothetical protein